MATDTNVNVKFKLDTSEVTKGTDDAKNKVKSAANEMASDVKNSSQKMSDSLQDVTKSATSAAKQMERQFDASAKNMEKSMNSVSKKMSAMMVAQGASNAMRMASSAVQSFGPALGMDEGAAKTTGSILNGAATGINAGAQLGTVIGGPGMGTAVGAAAGGLMGAASALMTAGKELQNAAKAQDERAKSDLETARREIVHQNSVSKWTNEAKTLAAAAYGDSATFGTDEGKAALASEIASQQQRIADLRSQRNSIVMNYDENGDVFAQAEKMRALDDAIAFATEKLNIFTQTAEKAADEEQKAIAAQEAGIKAAEQAIEARKKEAEAARKKTEAEEARIAAQMEKNEIDSLKDEKRESEKTMADYERQLQGVISNPSATPSDQLTRIGGGNGYASYNSSTAQVQKNIESHLKSVIKILQDSITETTSRLDALINKDNEMVWAKP